MKKIIAVLIVIILAAVITAVIIQLQNTGGVIENPAQYGERVNLQEGQCVTMPDRLMITLRTINDSRCKPDVQCIWAGELAGHFYLTGGALEKNAYEMVLGTTTNPNAIVGIYQFMLQSDSQTKELSFIVIKN